MEPSVNGVVAVIDQAPPVTVAVPIVVTPSSNVTVSPVTPLPLKVGETTLVMLSVTDDPLSDDASTSGVLGGAGTGSIIIERETEGRELVVPSDWTAVMLYGPPTDSVVVGINQVPLDATTALPTEEPPTNSVTLSPATPFPVMTGVVTSVRLSPGMPVSLSSVREVGAVVMEKFT